MKFHNHSHSRLIAACGSAVVCASVIAGCSTTKLAVNNERPARVSDAPTSATAASSTTSLPGSPEFATAESVKHPEKIHLAYARWQESQRQPALARESYQKVLSHDPKSVDALLGLARLDQLAGRPAEAEQHLARAQQLQPHSALIQAAWGEYYTAQQNWPRAIERYRQAIRMAPDETIYKHQLAVALVKSGAINEGLAMFTAIVGQPEAHYNVGLLLHQQGRLVEAEEHLQRALILKPELTPASSLMAKIQRQRGLSPSLAGNTPPAHAAPPPAVSPPAGPPPTAAPVTSAGWTAARTSTVQPATFTPPPPGMASPQQLEQWHNQQSGR